MALILVVLSGLFGAVAALVGLIGFDVSFAHALALYLVSSIVPVALVMAGVFLQMQFSRPMTAHEGQTSHIGH